MNKQIKFNQDARESIKKGLDTLANAVKVTLGPFGKNVVIQTVDNFVITKDGATVANSINLEDNFENIGVKFIKSVAEKTRKEVGDNTTTSTILTQSIVNYGMESLNEGYSPLNIKKGIEKAVDVVINGLNSREVSSLEDVASVAGNDQEIGKIVVDVFNQVGLNGKITIENSTKKGFETEIVKGISFDKGYIHEKMFVKEMENCPVLVLDKKVEEIKEIVPILEKIQGKNILIIAEDFDDKVVNTLALNKVSGGFNAITVKAPSFGEGKKNFLEDLKIFIGGELGTVDKVIVKKDETIIIGGKGDVTERVNQLNLDQEGKSDFEKEKIKERIAKLTSGIGVIKVGADSEAEIGEIKDRVEDAVCAIRSALEEGIVEGGGCALIRTLPLLDQIETSNLGELQGIDIIRKAIQEPIKQLLNNASKDLAILDRVKTGEGYSSKTDTFGDLFEMGIVDTKKGIRVALQNASSSASIFLTTDSIVCFQPTTKKD